ncbi:MAG: phospho-N-acetylmuramoyl-pentapeptide-transferase, partial [Oscillospiraceae bacterium]|nr:phospho-N-acetylmuramoyl-pentapeptide-transferase [Oscillospiraceae bacterium]
IPFTVFVMYGTSNALNFTDGVDGLASSVTMLVMASFTVAAAISVSGDSAAALTAAFAGGCLGFLFFNAHPARVMMGDCGSLALGGAVAAAAVAMRGHWVLLFFGVIYVAEGLSVIIQVSYFKRTRRRIFKMAPIHHHFELSGWGEWRIVFVFCSITCVFCLAGLWLLFGRVF